MTHGTEKDNILKVHGGPLRPEVGSTSTRSARPCQNGSLSGLTSFWCFFGFHGVFGFQNMFQGFLSINRHLDSNITCLDSRNNTFHQDSTSKVQHFCNNKNIASRLQVLARFKAIWQVNGSKENSCFKDMDTNQIFKVITQEQPTFHVLIVHAQTKTGWKYFKREMKFLRIFTSKIWGKRKW